MAGTDCATCGSDAVWEVVGTPVEGLSPGERCCSGCGAAMFVDSLESALYLELHAEDDRGAADLAA